MDLNNYYIPIAPRSSLLCLFCTVDPNEIRDSSAKSFFHWKTLKCRFIINLMPTKVIASPISSAKASFFIIMTRDFYNSGELQKIMKELNLTYSSPQPVTPRAYTDCIKYTFEFYLSPLWNKVAQVLMAGYDFLKNSDFNDAIISHIDLVSEERSPEDEIRINLKPISAKLPPMRLENLAIPSVMIGDFLQNPNGVLNVSTFGTQRVIIVPSMRKAIVTRVLKKIPERCPFKNYSEIRRHWKNMYGYRLPKTDDGMIYYEVYFPIPNKQVVYFTYPDICIRNEMTQRPPENPDLLTRKFLQDLHYVMPTMLGRPIQIFPQSTQSQVNEDFEKASNSQKFITPLQANSIGNLKDTQRLSFSGGQPLEKKQRSTQMSPTPSIRGKRTGDFGKKLNFEKLKKIQEIHSSSVRDSKKSDNYVNNLKLFKTEDEKSSYFQNSSENDRKRLLINIFTPDKRRKANSSFEINSNDEKYEKKI